MKRPCSALHACVNLTASAGVSGTTLKPATRFSRDVSSASAFTRLPNSETVRSYSGPKRCLSLSVRCFCMTSQATTLISSAIRRTAAMTVLVGIVFMIYFLVDLHGACHPVFASSTPVEHPIGLHQKSHLKSDKTQPAALRD